MKKKILSLGVIAVLIVMLISLTGCGNNNEISVENDANQSANNDVDKGEEIIYQFEKYVQNKDNDGIASIFEAKRINNISDKFRELFKDDFSYDIISVHKVENDETFKEHFDPEQAQTLVNNINKKIEYLGENITAYIVKGKQKVGNNETVDFSDFFFVHNENNMYKIVSTTNWDFTFYENPNKVGIEEH